MINLEELAIEENPIGPTGLVSLLQAVSDNNSNSNSKIRRLYIGRCNPTLQVLHALSETLSLPTCSLETLGSNIIIIIIVIIIIITIIRYSIYRESCPRSFQ